MSVIQALQEEIAKHDNLITSSTQEVNRLRAALHALEGRTFTAHKPQLVPAKKLHWTQRPENKAKVKKRIKLMQKAKRS